MIDEKKITKQHFNSCMDEGKIIPIKMKKRISCTVGQSQKLHEHFCLFIYVNTMNLFLLPGGARRQKESDFLRQ